MKLDLLTASGLTAAVSILFSLIFILIPPARRWFTALSAENQQAIVGAGILITAVVAISLGCAGVLPFIACSAPAIFDYFIGVVVVAIMGDRASKATFATARWWDTRAKRGQASKTLDAPRSGKLLY